MSEMSACRSAGGVKSWLDLEWRREDVSNGGGGIGVVRTGVEVVVGGGGGEVVVVVVITGASHVPNPGSSPGVGIT
ncbi:hypothetical protein TrRE_jg9784 [Triparma retinervis]|uniref:Uncharacterized protein n=1 Tax=Triparma retinervis TaxID=2557542 RepID=A0A9W7G9L1_9STRA|nr:hypothetical protein TrRE_jg9784 [Triparma retinervis]